MCVCVQGMAHGENHCSIARRPIKMGREAMKEGENGAEKEREARTEKSNGTGESKTNPHHNLPL